MHPLIVAALILLQTFAPDTYQLVSRYEIRVDNTITGGGTIDCQEDIIIISTKLTKTGEQTAGVLAHEAKHLDDKCPMYNTSGVLAYREAAAYRYQLTVLRRIPNTTQLQTWVANRYWHYWWKEHGRVWSLGILP